MLRDRTNGFDRPNGSWVTRLGVGALSTVRRRDAGSAVRAAHYVDLQSISRVYGIPGAKAAKAEPIASSGLTPELTRERINKSECEASAIQKSPVGFNVRRAAGEIMLI